MRGDVQCLSVSFHSVFGVFEIGTGYQPFEWLTIDH